MLDQIINPKNKHDMEESKESIKVGDVFLDEQGIRHEIYEYKKGNETTLVLIYDEIVEFETEVLEKKIELGYLFLVERSTDVSPSGRQGLNKELMIPFVEAKGAYHIIAKICNLEHIKDGIFKAPSGFKYILTKFGFEQNINYNYQLKYAETLRELKKLQADHEALKQRNKDMFVSGNLGDLRRQIDNLKSKEEGRKHHIARVEEQNKELKEKVSELRQTVVGKNRIIRKLNGEIEKHFGKARVEELKSDDKDE
jgi:hypothetical protein